MLRTRLVSFLAHNLEHTRIHFAQIATRCVPVRVRVIVGYELREIVVLRKSDIDDGIQQGRVATTGQGIQRDRRQEPSRGKLELTAEFDLFPRRSVVRTPQFGRFRSE